MVENVEGAGDMRNMASRKHWLIVPRGSHLWTEEDFDALKLTEGQRNWIRVLVDRARFDRVKPVQVDQWVDQLAMDVLDLEKNGLKASRWTGFFVHLADALLALPRYFDELLEYFSALAKPSDHERSLVFILHRARAILEEIHRAMTDEELIYVNYRRNCSCHIFQDDYRLDVSKKTGKVNEVRKERLVGREMRRDEIQAVLDRIIADHNIEEEAIAVKLGVRLGELVRGFQKTVKVLLHLMRPPGGAWPSV